MSNYLGEFPVDVSKHPVYSKWTPSDWAMLFVEKYGQIDGGHHKTWVLDQVARILKGTPVVVVQARWTDHKPEDRFTVASPPSEEYQNWVCDMKGPWVKTEHYEGFEYSYDEGIAP
jgi:hypothetical protein